MRLTITAALLIKQHAMLCCSTEYAKGNNLHDHLRVLRLPLLLLRPHKSVP
jgi:hypothetical protein